MQTFLDLFGVPCVSAIFVVLFVLCVKLDVMDIKRRNRREI